MADESTTPNPLTETFIDNLDTITTLSERRNALQEVSQQLQQRTLVVGQHIAELEQRRINAIGAGDTETLDSIQEQITQYEQTNRILAERNSIISTELDTAGAQSTVSRLFDQIGGDVSNGLQTIAPNSTIVSGTLDRLNTMLGENTDELSDMRGAVLGFGTAIGVAGALVHKYSDALLQSTAAFGPNIAGNGELLSSIFGLQKMMAGTGLTLEELSAVAKNNRVAWRDSSTEIIKFVGENDLMRLRMGKTREEFAEMTAVAMNQAKESGKTGPALVDETESYIRNLKILEIQTGRQASEIEQSRRDAKTQAGGFLLTLEGEARNTFKQLIDDVSDARQNNNPIAALVADVFKSADVGERIQEANKLIPTLLAAGTRAGIDASTLKEFQIVTVKAAEGDVDAAERLGQLTTTIGEQIRDSVASGKSFVSAAEASSLDPEILQKGFDALSGEIVRDEKGTIGVERREAADDFTAFTDKGAEGAEDLFLAFSKLQGILRSVGGDVAGIVAALVGASVALRAAAGGISSPGIGGGPDGGPGGNQSRTSRVLGAVGRFAGNLGIIGALIGGMVLIVQAVSDNWEDISKFFEELWTDVSGWLSGPINTLTAAFSDKFPRVARMIGDMVGTLGDVFSVIGTRIGQLIDDPVGYLTENLLDPLFGFFDSLFSGEIGAADVMGFFMGALKDWYSTLFTIAEGAGTIFDEFVLEPLEKWLFDTFNIDVDISNLFEDYIMRPIQSIFTWISDVIQGLFDGDKINQFIRDKLGDTVADLLGFDEVATTPTEPMARTGMINRSRALTNQTPATDNVVPPSRLIQLRDMRRAAMSDQDEPNTINTIQQQVSQRMESLRSEIRETNQPTTDNVTVLSPNSQINSGDVRSSDMGLDIGNGIPDNLVNFDTPPTTNITPTTIETARTPSIPETVLPKPPKQTTSDSTTQVNETIDKVIEIDENKRQDASISNTELVSVLKHIRRNTELSVKLLDAANQKHAEVARNTKSAN